MKAIENCTITSRRLRWWIAPLVILASASATFLSGAVYESRHPFLPGDFEWVAPDTDLIDCERLILQAEPRLDPNIARYYAFHLSRAARDCNVPPELAVAVIHYESHWNSLAVSPKGARGLGQIMPGTHGPMLQANGNTEDEAHHVGVQVRDTCAYLSGLLRRFPTPQLAVAAYNAGPNNEAIKAGRVPQNKETPCYTRDVLAMYAALKIQTVAMR